MAVCLVNRCFGASTDHQDKISLISGLTVQSDFAHANANANTSYNGA